MNENRPEYEETERMKQFRLRKEKELRRRKRNKCLAIGFAIVIMIGIVAGAAVAAVHLFRDLQSKPEEITEPQTQVETAGLKTREPSSQETTEEATTQAPQPQTKAPDPREDVWNHYNNMFVASKVESHLNVRDQPSKDGTIVGKLTKYSGGELLEDLGNGWWHISSGEIEGYIWAEYCVTGEEAKQVALEHCIQMVEVTTEKLNVRSGPGLEYDVWTTLNASEKQVVKSREGEWLKIAFDSTFGYINDDFVRTGYYLVEAVPWSSISDCSPERQKLLTYGEQFIGTRYVYGGTSLTDGIDCSSFVQQCFANALGIKVDRTSRQQANNGTVITLAEAKPGDLLFYADATGTIDHVVFYLGDGKILHAAQSLGQVTISKYNYSTEPVRVVNIIGD